jgi:hypothetical protein
MKFEKAAKASKQVDSKAAKIKEITDYVYDKLMQDEDEHDSDVWEMAKEIIKDNFDEKMEKSKYVELVKSELESF